LIDIFCNVHCSGKNRCRYNRHVQATPAILVTGASGAAKQAFVLALLAARPAAEHWAVLDNDNSHPATLQQSAQLRVARINGCMCCTGQLALQTGIVQLLRRSHPQRLIIVVSAAAEPAPLERALQQGHLVRAITIAHHWFVATPQDLTPELASARLLRQQQLEAADMVVAGDAAQAGVLRATVPALGIAAKRVATTAEALRAMVPVASTAGD
jgi:G3E family GTPase